MQKIIATFTSLTFLSVFLMGCSSPNKNPENQHNPVIFGQTLNKNVSPDELREFKALTSRSYQKKDQSNGVLKIYITNDNKIYLVNKLSEEYETLEACQRMFDQDKSSLHHLIDESDNKKHKSENITLLTYGDELFKLNTIPCRNDKVGTYHYIINFSGESMDVIKSSSSVANNIGGATNGVLMGVVFILAAPVILIGAVVGSIFD